MVKEIDMFIKSAEVQFLKIIENELEPSEASKWAEEQYFNKKLGVLIDGNSRATEIMDMIHQAAMLNEKGGLLYGNEDMKAWWRDYTSELMQ